MIMQTILKKICFWVVRTLFETFPTQNLLRYLPQRNQDMLSGIYTLDVDLIPRNHSGKECVII